jgi:carbon monoxide dehydrogenase subunit G
MDADLILIERTMKAPPEYVFDSIADPEKLGRLRRGVSAKLQQPGPDEPHGVGAVRRVDTGPLFLEEHVTGYDRPRRFEYHIRRARPPITHHGGVLAIEPAGDGSRVRWETRVTAGVATRLANVVLKKALSDVLTAIDRRFEDASR